MSLLDAPVYDERKARRNRSVFITVGALVALLILLTPLGFILGHGWLFTNLGYEHLVGSFYAALQAGDYDKAYGIYQADPDWKQHPEKYSGYSLKRFTEDWTVPEDSEAGGPVKSYHVDISRTDGSGAFGTGVIVAATVNTNKRVFIYVNKADKTFTCPAPHVIGY
jgi:hypothetical protein